MITGPPMDQDVQRGASFNLTCVAEGDEATLSIQWERGGVLVGNGEVVGDSLVFTEALPSHAGNYVCVASDESGEDRAEAAVTVSCESFPPIIHTHSCSIICLIMVCAYNDMTIAVVLPEEPVCLLLSERVLHCIPVGLLAGPHPHSSDLL